MIEGEKYIVCRSEQNSSNLWYIFMKFSAYLLFGIAKLRDKFQQYRNINQGDNCVFVEHAKLSHSACHW